VQALRFAIILNQLLKDAEAMKGLKIGHFTQRAHGTGASVFLFDTPAVGSYYQCGSSPATHELGPLELSANVTHLNGLGLFGGSAFGLTAVAGMMRWLNDAKLGWKVSHGVVPIVPAAAIYDLAVQQALPPTAQDVYAACVAAREDNREVGQIGAGTGATVGKVIPDSQRMSGGLGRAEFTLANGVSVLAYSVVNSVGDVRDTTGKIIAGARLANGEFGDCEQWLLHGYHEKGLPPATNTTLTAIFTDAKFSKIELQRIAKMAVAGMGRAIAPAFTRYDGDIIFCISLGEKAATEVVVGSLAAHLTQQSIINAVRDSVILKV
jgi:L-aminopeptidase/D-esterase-like protein